MDNEHAAYHTNHRQRVDVPAGATRVVENQDE